MLSGCSSIIDSVDVYEHKIPKSMFFFIIIVICMELSKRGIAMSLMVMPVDIAVWSGHCGFDLYFLLRYFQFLVFNVFCLYQFS